MSDSHGKGYRELVRFERPSDAELWQPIDDVVMGGQSASRLQLDEDGVPAFTGDVSLANNGGFASVRSQPERVNLEEYAGLELHTRGDGKQYRFRLRTRPGWGGVAYQAVFDTMPGLWQTVRFPFSTFRATYRGRSVPDAPPLDPSQIYTYGLMIADKQDGPFRLELGWLRAFS